VLFAPPIVFKGSGFYKTDSRGSEATGSSGASSEEKPESSSDTADTKPAAKDDGHGHTHGPGGHTHDKPTTPKKDAEPTAAG
jgi:hypothetical protein